MYVYILSDKEPLLLHGIDDITLSIYGLVGT